MSVSIAVIGGGSSMFVPGLVRRLLELRCFEGARLRLMDIDSGRLAVMETLTRELAAAESRRLTIEATTDQRKAIEGADFIIIAISVGGMDAWASDIELPARHGVFMHIADSIGPGGIFRSLRNTPVVASVVRDAAEIAPDAYVFNYTNPASANAIAMAMAAPTRSVSLCSCSPLPRQRAWLRELVGIDEGEVVVPMRVGGINHCTGMLSLRLADGRDAIPLVRERTADSIIAWAIDIFGVVPYCSAHWIEFFPQLQWLEEDYTGRAQGLLMRYGRRIYDMDNQRQRMREWETVASRWSSEGGTHHLRDLPHGPEDEGIVVVELMEAIVDDRSEVFIVNTMNHGLVDNLPGGVAVEVPALVSGDGIHPTSIGPLPVGLASVLSRHALVQRLTAEAALAGNRELLAQAMTVDPLLDARLEPGEIAALMNEMIEANRKHLGGFAASD